MKRSHSSALFKYLKRSLVVLPLVISISSFSSQECEIAVYFSQFERCPLGEVNQLNQVANQFLSQKGYQMISQWDSPFVLEAYGPRSENSVRVFVSYQSPFPDEGLLPYSVDQTMRDSLDSSCIRPLIQTLERLETCGPTRPSN